MGQESNNGNLTPAIDYFFKFLIVNREEPFIYEVASSEYDRLQGFYGSIEGREIHQRELEFCVFDSTDRRTIIIYGQILLTRAAGTSRVLSRCPVEVYDMMLALDGMPDSEASLVSLVDLDGEQLVVRTCELQIVEMPIHVIGEGENRSKEVSLR